MTKIRFGARLARILTIQSTETAKDTRIIGLTGQDGKPYQRYATLTSLTKLEWNIVKETASAVDELGYDFIILPDHIRMEGGPRYESWTLSSAIAAITRTARLGHLVLCNGWRHPPLLAKMGMTLDHISNGRFELGLGAGYAKEEFESFGYSFPSAPVRIEQLKEAVEIIKLMWTEEHPTYKGKYYTIKDAICNPKPIQKPHPPITIGGNGRKILRVAAQLADRVNLQGSFEECKKALEILREHCRDVGRDYDEIEKSWGQYLFIADERRLKEKEDALKMIDQRTITIGTPDQVKEKINEYAKLGITIFTWRFEDLPDLTGLRLFAEEVMPVYK